MCHYVDTACVKEGDSWFLCNDEIVTQVPSVHICKNSIRMIVAMDKFAITDIKCVCAVYHQVS